MAKTKETTRKSKTNSLPQAIDRRRKIDIGKALQLRIEGKLTYKEIAKQLGHSKQGIIKALKPFINLLKDPGAVSAYNHNRSKFLNAVEMELVAEMVDPDKVKKASINNIAYAANTVHNMYRLNEGQTTQNTGNIVHVLLDLKKDLDTWQDKLGGDSVDG